MSFLSTLDVSKYIVSVCRTVGVTVKWDKPDSTPRTNGKVMYLPTMSASITPEQVVKLKQFVKHETSHIQYSDFDLLEKYRPTGLLMLIDNMLEDHRIDYLNDSEYEGDRNNTEQFLTIYQRELRKEIKADNVQFADVFAPMLAWESDVREDLWAIPPKLFAEYMSADGVKVYDKLHAGDYADVLRSIRTIKDKTIGGEAIYRLAVRILEEVFGQKAEDHTDKSATPTKGEGKDKGEVEDVSEGEGVCSDDADGEQGERPKLIEVDMKNKTILPYTVHTGAKGEGINAKNYKTTDKHGDYYPTPRNEIQEWDFVSNTGKNLCMRRFADYDSYSKHIEKATQGAEHLAHQVRTKLQILSRDRYEYGKKRGVLHNSALYRATIKDAKGFNERIFKNKITNDTLNVAVQVLVDCSGSMSGSKYTNAAASAVLLNDVISRVLRIPVEILGFTERDGHIMYIFKPFDKQVSADNLTKSFSTAGNLLMDNVDGESLMYGYNNIIKRREKRKLMIVLSDGSPCGGYEKGNIINYTREVIKNIEASPVEIVGIGVLYNAVRGYYKKWAYIDEAKNIQSTLLNVISNHIIAEGV